MQLNIDDCVFAFVCCVFRLLFLLLSAPDFHRTTLLLMKARPNLGKPKYRLCFSSHMQQPTFSVSWFIVCAFPSICYHSSSEVLCKYPSASRSCFPNIYHTRTSWNINFRLSFPSKQLHRCYTDFWGLLAKLFLSDIVCVCVCQPQPDTHMGLLGPPKQMLHLQNYAFRAEK